jgi:CheY-like chemotaxis protein
VLIRVLLVEDDALQADLTRKILESQHFYIEVAFSGLDAIRRILSGWFDVVLMDHHIPDFDGVAVGQIICDIIRSQGRPRLIALSASPVSISIRETGHSSVFDRVIAKPWDALELIAAIRHCHQTLPPPTHRMQVLQPCLPIRYNTAHTAPRTVRVLVIDDDGPLRAVVCLALEAAGYSVDHAVNGLDALKTVVTSAFDVAVVDYQIPYIDGLATGRLIFDLLLPAERPRLIALTSTPELLAGQDAGGLSVFDEVVGKHHGIKALLDSVDRCANYKTLRTRVDPPEVIRLDSILSIAIDSL